MLKYLLDTNMIIVGRPIGPYDMMIAGQARASGLILVTNNVKKFARAPGLLLEDWCEAPGSL